MRRVEKALVDLNTTNLKSNQKAITEFNTLLVTGSSKLQDMMRSMLSEQVTPVEPLHYLTKGMNIDMLKVQHTRISAYAFIFCVQNSPFLRSPMRPLVILHPSAGPSALPLFTGHELVKATTLH